MASFYAKNRWPTRIGTTHSNRKSLYRFFMRKSRKWVFFRKSATNVKNLWRILVEICLIFWESAANSQTCFEMLCRLPLWLLCSSRVYYVGPLQLTGHFYVLDGSNGSCGQGSWGWTNQMNFWELFFPNEEFDGKLVQNLCSDMSIWHKISQTFCYL